MNEVKDTDREPSIHQALLDELLQRSSQAIVLLNRDSEILFCSQGIKSIIGYEPEELIGRTVFDFFHPAVLSAARGQHQYLAGLTENTSASLLQVRNKQGHMIWIDAVVKNLLEVAGINAFYVLLKKSSDAGAEERQLIQAATNAKEQEREFLAGEPHDNINQVITATKLLVDAARFSPEKEELLQLSSANLRFIIEEIRKLSYSMVNYDLQKHKLAFAVHEFLTTLNRACAVKFRATFDEPAVDMLTSDQQLHIYRIIQEGMNNIIRHADATLAEITLTREEGLICLTMTDNGKGFSINRLKPGIGLSSMTNRVKLLRGRFHVRAPQGTGTTVEIHFPV